MTPGAGLNIVLGHIDAVAKIVLMHGIRAPIGVYSVAVVAVAAARGRSRRSNNCRSSDVSTCDPWSMDRVRQTAGLESDVLTTFVNRDGASAETRP